MDDTDDVDALRISKRKVSPALPPSAEEPSI
jgi:hypothetical protein